MRPFEPFPVCLYSPIWEKCKQEGDYTLHYLTRPFYEEN